MERLKLQDYVKIKCKKYDNCLSFDTKIFSQYMAGGFWFFSTMKEFFCYSKSYFSTTSSPVFILVFL